MPCGPVCVPWSLACLLQMRGVVSRELCFRFRKAAARKAADPTTGAPAALKYTACPAGCGTFLMRGRKLLKSEFERKKER